MNDRYQTPLAERYASKEMQYIFSPDMKFKTWRRLWIALAETEKELGLDITDEQIAELKAHKDDINYDIPAAAHSPALDIHAEKCLWQTIWQARPRHFPFPLYC